MLPSRDLLSEPVRRHLARGEKSAKVQRGIAEFAFQTRRSNFEFGNGRHRPGQGFYRLTCGLLVVLVL
jgi:hypothetical protein